MLNDKNRSFKTPSALIVRLNPEYFFGPLFNNHSDEETKFSNTMLYSSALKLNNVMYGRTLIIENLFLIPAALTQFFTLCSVIFRLNTYVFCYVFLALYALGCVLRLTKPNLLSFGLMYLSSVNNLTWWLWYPLIIIFLFINKSFYLIVPFLIMKLTTYILSLLQNGIVQSISLKKYGIPFNDVEICALNVFNFYLNDNEDLSDYIKDYVSAECSQTVQKITENKKH